MITLVCSNAEAGSDNSALVESTDWQKQPVCVSSDTLNFIDLLCKNCFIVIYKCLLFQYNQNS